MRRSTGIQALECHLLITRLPSVAKSIIDSINSVCNKYKNNQNKNTNVFQYSPYTSFSKGENIADNKSNLNSQLSNKLMNQQQNHTHHHQSHHTNAKTDKINHTEKNQWSVISSTPPIPIRNKTKTNLLPPKSPLNFSNKPHKNTQANFSNDHKPINEVKNGMESSSVANLSTKSANSSLFSKLKSYKNKSTSGHENELPKTPKSEKKKPQKENNLFSVSSVGFDETNPNTKATTPKKTILKKMSKEFDSNEKNIRSTSALGSFANGDQRIQPSGKGSLNFIDSILVRFRKDK
jgi:hypothetical protein